VEDIRWPDFPRLAERSQLGSLVVRDYEITLRGTCGICSSRINWIQQRRDTVGKVARQVVEQAGLNVDVLLDKLIRAAGAEFTTFYYYTILRVNAIGFDGEGLKEIIEDARIEDRNHFEALTPRIYELGGALPRDIRGFADIAGCPDAYLPQNPRDIKAMLNVLVEAERCAVRTTPRFAI